MVITRTPFRISFFGGGTDYPEWYLKHGGAVLSTTFDKYCYITSRELPPFFNHKYRITYSKVEDTNTIEEIEHPAVRAVLKESNCTEGLEIHCDADLPARSGLGSSSSFVVGLLHSLKTMQGETVTQEWLAEEAIRIEQQVLRESVGSQDQVASAIGGFNVIRFTTDGHFEVEPIGLSAQRQQELENNLMLFFTGFSRIASEIAQSKIANFENKMDELSLMRAMVDDAVSLLRSDDDIRIIGEMLHKTWQLKRSLSEKVSNPAIDALYKKAREAGAIGGKLLGAGGGGFLLLFTEPEKQPTVQQALAELVCVPFQFESTGSQICLDKI